ncbi:MAG: lipopolysaccharide kinase InaA family protein [Sulfurimonas sp.]|nr:lipopolysaccharide kinase InaA family protein [Sulfurimonas sp.]
MKYNYNIQEDFIAFKEYLLDIQAYFRQNNTTIHKARNELKIININSLDTVVKSFKVPNIFRKIIYTYFRDSKAKKSYEYSVKLKDFTPSPIGYIEFYIKSLINDSYFISERFDYDFTIREPLLDDGFKNKEAILRALARFSLQLHNQGIFHDDYSPGNILIKKEDSHFIFKIVDVNRMKFFDLKQKDRAKNFSKLWASDDELKIIADEYSKYYSSSEDFAKQMCYYSNKNKRIKNFKKRLKGKPVND